MDNKISLRAAVALRPFARKTRNTFRCDEGVSLPYVYKVYGYVLLPGRRGAMHRSCIAV